jgi:nicotinamide mononucleotide transporter
MIPFPAVVAPMLGQLQRDLLATSPLELLAAALGIVYVVLIVRRQRFGWVAGGVSSAMYVWLAAGARLPMQSGLQLFYVFMSFYGWWSWTRNQREEHGRIASWPWSRHVLAVLLIVALSFASARWLAGQLDAAWPLLDSLTTLGSLYATWLVARSVLQNWLYWIVLDAITIFLFARQGHPVTAALYLCFLLIAARGFFTWRRLLRAQARTPAVTP